MNDKTRTKNLPRGQAAWNRELRKIDGKAKRIVQQLGAASVQFPEIVTSFRLLVAYVGFIERRRDLPIGPPEPAPYPFLTNFCKYAPIICKCVEGDESACVTLGKAPDRQPEPQPSCPQLWKDYQQAIEELLRKFVGSGMTGRGAAVGTQQTKVQRLWDQLLAQGCVIKQKPA